MVIYRVICHNTFAEHEMASTHCEIHCYVWGWSGNRYRNYGRWRGNTCQTTRISSLTHRIEIKTWHHCFNNEYTITAGVLRLTCFIKRPITLKEHKSLGMPFYRLIQWMLQASYHTWDDSREEARRTKLAPLESRRTKRCCGSGKRLSRASPDVVSVKPNLFPISLNNRRSVLHHSLYSD